MIDIATEFNQFPQSISPSWKNVWCSSLEVKTPQDSSILVS